MNESIEKYRRRWNLILEKEMETFSSTVCIGKQGDTPIVLKLPRLDLDEAHQAQMLRHYDGKGAVRVLRSDDEAMLLERLSPGRHLIELTQAGRDEEATQIFCETARQLHNAKGPLNEFKTIAALASGFDRYLNAADPAITPSDVRRAKTLFQSLVSSQAEPVLLHGDLHHDNILSDDIRGWTAIDPKGYAGEPVYEAGAWLRNPMPVGNFAARAIVENRVAIMAEEMGWDANRVLHWSYAQAILSAIWSIEDKQNPEAALAIAAVLEEMI